MLKQVGEIWNQCMKKIINYKVWAFLIVFLIWIPVSSSFLDYMLWIRTTAVFILAAMIIVLIKLCKLNKSLFTLSSLFVVFLNIFHFGNVFIVMINPDYNFMIYSFVTENAPLQSVVLAVNFCVLTTFFIYFGLLYHANKHKCVTFSKEKYKLSLKQLKIFSYIIILLSFPLQLYIDINKLVLAFSADYLATYNFSISGVLIQIGAFYIIGFIMLMIANKENKKSTYIYLFIMFYQGISMFSGNRARQVLVMLIISFIYFFLMKKISFSRKNIKIILLLAIPTYILVNCIVNISSFRMNIGSDPMAFLQACLLPQKNILFAIFDEFGYTLYTMVLEIERVTGFGMGLTYVGSFMTILPTIFPIQEQILTFSTFTMSLDYGGIGGTIIGELYYNFAWFGCVFGIAIGILVNWFSTLFTTVYKEKNYFLFSLLILPAINLLWWTRDMFLNIPRMLIYEFIFLFIIYHIVKYVTKKSKGEITK